MGKSLIIKGADFSQVSVNTEVLVSNSQLSLGTNTYYNDSGEEVSVEGIEGVQKIVIPEGITMVRVKTSSINLEPVAINCFSNNGYIGLSGGSNVGGFESKGYHLWYYLPLGTTYISYVYKNTQVWNLTIGLDIEWYGQ